MEPLGQPREGGSTVKPDFLNRCLVIIPANDEQECIGGVVRQLQDVGFARIRVIANGCRDRTAEVAQGAGAEVVSLEARGYGMACWAGASEIPDGVEWLVYCNADASDDFSAYDKFAELSGNHDLLLGARTHPEDRCHMSASQRFGNWLAPWLIGWFWGRQFADLGPQRAIRVASYQRLNMQDRGFGWTLEMQVRAVEEGLRIAEIPVRTHPRPAGRQKISGTLRGSFLAGTIILTTLLRLKIFPRSTVPTP
jgi:glycosyltransferase involved in cell wall biosynthesis